MKKKNNKLEQNNFNKNKKTCQITCSFRLMYVDINIYTEKETLSKIAEQIWVG
jgi:hypothetical protein